MNMRKIAVVGLTLTALTVKACGDGSSFGESFKTSFRAKLVSSCTSTARGSVPAGVEIDLDKICGCAADKIMAGKSAKDLATTVPGSTEDLAKMRACVSELGPVKIGA